MMLCRSDLELIDAEASTAHDFIWSTSDVSREQASAAIWSIHNLIRAALAEQRPGHSSCALCGGRGYISDGQPEDGMVTGRMDCPGPFVRP